MLPYEPEPNYSSVRESLEVRLGDWFWDQIMKELGCAVWPDDISLLRRYDLAWKI